MELSLDNARCPSCKSQTSQCMRYCPTCGADMGCPNVRAATSNGEASALSSRYEAAQKHAQSRDVEKEFSSLTDTIATASHVVVAMPPFVARMLLLDPRRLYAGYEALVDSHTRAPAPFQFDSERRSVSGKLFGSYANDINYGLLSLDGRGLSNYGSVFACLHDFAVKDRVSFLHENSYHFLQKYASSPQATIPLGFRSDWTHKSLLAAAKIEANLAKGSTPMEWADQLVASGKDRASDEFIEAHIYGPFNALSISTVLTSGIGDSREERNDISCIKEYLKESCQIGSKK